MIRRTIPALAALALVASPAALPPAQAQVPSEGALTDTPRIDLDALRDRLTTRGEEVAVMLELDVPPASVAYSSARSPRSARVATAVAISRIQRAQASVRAQLGSAEELFTATNVYAGIAVRADLNDLERLASIRGVKSVQVLTPKERDNFVAVPLVAAPQTWVDTGFTGEGITVGIIDTGIDFTHADFGGPGTVAAYNSALAAKDAGQSPTYPDPVKVAGGYDFVGNAYDGYNDIDPGDNPLDCGGHGTHVAGSAAGYGVAADGSTYRGPWDESTPFDTMGIGPGVAPAATLYALKVFGCEGSTNYVVPALEWAADPNGDGDFSDRLDVVNMSLGSTYGSPADPDSVASNNLVDIGTAVIASAGNSGDVYEVTGSPGDGVKVLSVAASDDNAQIVDGFGATIAGAEQQFPALFSEAYPWSSSAPTTAPVAEIGDWSTEPSSANNTDGCDAFSVQDAALMSGKIALLTWDPSDVTRRCGSATRTQNAADAGAVGTVFGSPETLFTTAISGAAAIPAVLTNVSGKTALHDALTAGQQVTVTLTNSLRNSERLIATGADDPTDTMMDFTSRGTALASNVKPDVSAPGGTIFSAAVGTGDQGVSYSGTSMAAPMTAGLAALVRQAHPRWSPTEVKAAIMNTANHDLYLDPARTGPRYDVLRAGSGRIDALQAVTTQATAGVVNDPGAVSVSFGVINATKSTSRSKTVRVTDHRTGGAAVKYALALDLINTVPGATYSLSTTSLTLKPGQSKDVTVTLALNPAKLIHRADPTVNLYPFADETMRDFLTVASGLITMKPSNGAPTLRVPLFSAPRPASTLSSNPVTVAGSGAIKTGTLTLKGSAIDNSGAKAYERERSRVSALQFVAESPQLPPCSLTVRTGCVITPDSASADLRYVGITSDAAIVAARGEDPLALETSATAYFGLTSWKPWRTAYGTAYFEIYIDTDEDGKADIALLNDSYGSDVFVAAAYSLRDIDPLNLVSYANLNNLTGDKDSARMHSNAMVLPLSLGALAHPLDANGDALPPFIEPGQTAISYWIESYDQSGALIDAVGQPSVPLRMDLTAPALTAFPANGVLPTVAKKGTALKVSMNPSTAGDAPRLLVIHHLNALAKKAEIVPVSG